MNFFFCLTTIFCLMCAIPQMAAADSSDVLRNVKVNQKLSDPLPLNVHFYNEHGENVPLGKYFKDMPVLLTFVYFHCPMLCPLNLKSLAQSLKSLGLKPGRDYRLLVVSFDPRDIAADKAGRLQKFLSMGGFTSPKGIHFLTGNGQSIARLTNAAGFHYVYNPDSGQFAHTTALLVATAQGRISRYFLGLNYPVRDIRLSLNEAQERHIGSLTQNILLFCFCYHPLTGRYSLAVLNLLKLAAAITLFVLVAVVLLLKRQERRL